MPRNVRVELDDRSLDRALTEWGEVAALTAAADAQEVLDSVHRTHAGRPVPEVMSRLRNATRQADWDVTDDELTPFAEAISAGTRIEVRPETS